MALFSRRVLQRVLDESHSYLSSKQRQDLCNLLNTVRDDYLATEWELVVVHAASGLGTVHYEPDLGGTSRPDFLFENSEGFTFIADITSVSDRGLHKQNPVEALHVEFRRQQRKLGMLHGGFDVRVNAYPNRVYRGSRERPRLRLPKVSEFHIKIFNAEFRQFMGAVRQNPEIPRQYEVNRDDTSVQFSYGPSRRGFGGGSHPAFDFAAIVDQNPVYNALNSKADQLKTSGYEGVRGIFLCDAGCRILHDMAGHWASYRIDEVIRHFLQQHQSVSFVVTFVVHDKRSWPGQAQQRFIEPTLYVNSTLNEQKEVVAQLLASLTAALPRPEQSPTNAMLRLKGRNGMTGRRLGTLKYGGAIEMSARMLFEILAGTRTIEDFEREYRMEKGENPFRRILSQGRLIDEVIVQHRPESDDDRVTIRFGAPDPAVMPFTVK